MWKSCTGSNLTKMLDLGLHRSTRCAGDYLDLSESFSLDMLLDTRRHTVSESCMLHSSAAEDFLSLVDVDGS